MRREDLPAISVAQMRDVEHWMIEEMGIAVLQMLENTGANFARLIIGRLGRVPAVVLAGRGNNGAGGLSAARHLSNRGIPVTIVLAQPLAGMSPTGAHQLETDRAMGIPILVGTDPPLSVTLGDAGVIIDALMGYHLSGQPQGETARLIEETMAVGRPVASLDLPSGIDPDTGQAFQPHIRAALTLTLGVPKKAVLAPSARELMGELYLSDLSMPPLLYERLGYKGPPIFAEEPVVRLE